MIPEERLRALPDAARAHFVRLEMYAVRMIAARIGNPRHLEAHRYGRMALIGADLRALDAEIARAAGLAARDVRAAMAEASRLEYRGVRIHADALGRRLPAWETDAALQRLVDEMAGATSGTFSNITGSRAVGMATHHGRVLPLPEFYRETVDHLALRARAGMDDWSRAVRDAARAMADGGLRGLVWESGYSLRLDTALRREVMAGLSRLSTAQAEMTAGKLGADGMEITWHDGYRPSHGFGGRQVTMLEWRTEYRARLMEPNCCHRAHPIFLGISTPAYTEEWLAGQRAANEREFEVGGRVFNRYSAEQAQRRFEAEIRKARGRAEAYAAAGLAPGIVNPERVRARRLMGEYRAFSAAAGLPARDNRTWAWTGAAVR